MIVSIYRIVSPEGKIYIGQTENFERRCKEYKCSKAKQQTLLHESFIKFGVESHAFEIIETCNKNIRNERERFYQELYKTTTEGLNLSLVGTTSKKQVHSEISKFRISKSNTGVSKGKRSIESITKMVETKYNKRRLSAPATAKFFNPKLTEKQILSLQKGSNKGYPIIQMDMEGNFISEWPNSAVAARTLGLNPCSIRQQMKGNQDHVRFFKFKPKYKQHENNKKFNFTSKEYKA